MAVEKDPNVIAARKPTIIHERYAEWISSVTGAAVTTESVAIVLRLHTYWLASPEYQVARIAQDEGRVAAQDAVAVRVRTRLEERVARAEQAAAELRAQLGVPAAPVAPEVAEKATKKIAAKQVAEKEPVKVVRKRKAAPPVEVVVPIRKARTRRGTQTPATDEDDPF